MTQFFRLFSLALVALLLMANTAIAEFRVATVDVNRILNESTDAKKKRKELDSLSVQAKKKLEKKRTALKNKEEKLKDKGVKPDSKEADKFRNEAREFAREVKDTEDNLRRKFVKSNEELTKIVLKHVQAYAKDNSIDLVLDKSVARRGPVLFGASAMDITPDIIGKLNK